MIQVSLCQNKTLTHALSVSIVAGIWVSYCILLILSYITQNTLACLSGISESHPSTRYSIDQDKTRDLKLSVFCVTAPSTRALTYITTLSITKLTD